MIDDYLRHYGTPRHSGRYPWGSGEDPYQDGRGPVTDMVNALRRKGFSEKEAAQAVGMSIAEIRAQKSLERAEKRARDVSQAQRLRAKGLSLNAIGERMNMNESSIRSLLDASIQERTSITKETTDMLRKRVGARTYVDVGKGIGPQLGISKERLGVAVKALQNEGFEVINVQVPQLGTDKKTTVKVLAPPGTKYKDVVQNMGRIKLPQHYSEDNGRSWLGVEPPTSISSDRLKVIYNEEGGGDKDGVIELRRGVEDLSLGRASYAQVRIGVNDTHFIKGMAYYSDDLPKGIDVRFHTNKSKKGSDLDALKPMSDDPDNPFGSTIKQTHYTDTSGKDRLSAVNIVGGDSSPNEEGQWRTWSNNLSSQMLGKQPTSLAKRQLNRGYQEKQKEFDDIVTLTNPVIKRRLLMALGDECDSQAAKLSAAALPRQSSHVLLPVVDMPDDQVYAPNYRNGEKVVLIRYPHGGKFEIPELTVNNSHKSAKRILGQAEDAVGISPAVANRLSGADFDGDHVLVIPNPQTGKDRIQTSSPLHGLKDFDPITEYPEVPGMKLLSEGAKQNKMGEVSNLITDMTLKAASPNEIARAVRHSMVIIDAEKHRLNWKLSEINNGIPQLREKYQGKKRGGASTLLSKANAEHRIPHREEGQRIGPISNKSGLRTKVYIDPKTGEKLYTPTGETYIDKNGKERIKLTKISARMDVTPDAHTLSSGTTMEGIYADHANALKALGNESRRIAVNTPNIPYSPTAKKQYASEVESLVTKLKAAQSNAPLERHAQILANEIVSRKRAENPDLKLDAIRKIKGQALTEARSRVGANKPIIVITPKEWQAIQSGAISNSRLESIVANADLDVIRSLATPRNITPISSATAARARALHSRGYTMAQIADQLGVSPSTVNTMLKQ